MTTRREDKNQVRNKKQAMQFIQWVSFRGGWAGKDQQRNQYCCGQQIIR